jgi:hypothetical protein
VDTTAEGLVRVSACTPHTIITHHDITRNPARCIVAHAPELRLAALSHTPTHFLSITGLRIFRDIMTRRVVYGVGLVLTIVCEYSRLEEGIEGIMTNMRRHGNDNRKYRQPAMGQL